MCNLALNAAIDLRLSGTQQALNAAICNRMNSTRGHRYTFASVERLGLDIGKSPATVRRHLRRMERQGIIHTEACPGRANRIYPVYTLARMGKPVYLPCRRTAAPYTLGFDAPQQKQTPLILSAPPLKMSAHPAQNERRNISKHKEKHNNNTAPAGAAPEQVELLPSPEDKLIKKSPPPGKPIKKRPARRKVVYTALERYWTTEQIQLWQQTYRDTKRGLWPTQAVVDGLTDQIEVAQANGVAPHQVFDKMGARGWVTFEWQWVQRDFRPLRQRPEPAVMTKNRSVMDIVMDTSW